MLTKDGSITRPKTLSGDWGLIRLPLLTAELKEAIVNGVSIREIFGSLSNMKRLSTHSRGISCIWN